MRSKNLATESHGNTRKYTENILLFQHHGRPGRAEGESRDLDKETADIEHRNRFFEIPDLRGAKRRLSGMTKHVGWGERSEPQQSPHSSVTQPNEASLTHLMYLYSVPRLAL